MATPTPVVSSSPTPPACGTPASPDTFGVSKPYVSPDCPGPDGYTGTFGQTYNGQNPLGNIWEFIQHAFANLFNLFTHIIAWLISLAVSLTGWMPNHTPIAWPSPDGWGIVFRGLSIFGAFVSLPLFFTCLGIVFGISIIRLVHAAFRTVLGFIPGFK